MYDAKNPLRTSCVQGFFAPEKKKRDEAKDMETRENQQKTDSVLQILQDADCTEYRPVVFWSINSKLEEGVLVRQIREMKSYHLGGFIFHARAGLTTEYLSREWFDLVEVCLREAERQGMFVWMYDEFGWPSGFVGGRLLAEPDFHARYLEYEVKDSYDPAAYAVYALEDGTPRLLRQGERAERYHTLYVRYSDAYVDILNPEVTDAFLAATYEPYYERFKDRFGKEFLGFFTDEPQYYRYATPISKVTEQEYERAYGEPLKEGLLYLFLEEESGYAFRVRYYNLMSRLYCENYYGRLYDWCTAHGCKLTGHSVEETFFFTQMWGGADCAASYLCEHVPAIDNLSRSSPACISAKSVGSVAAQAGKRDIMTETFGCSGFGVTPRELRLVADKQYVHGVNLMCQHLYNYSLAGQGKTDHPVSFGRTLPWIGGYASFNDYFAQLGWLLANSEEDAPVAVITPMESIYLYYQRLQEDAARNNVDVPFLKSLALLRESGVAYHFVNEKVLQKLGSVQDGKLRVGERVYEAVVVANCAELKQSTADLLKKVQAAGGRVGRLGDLPAYIEGKKSDVSFLSQTAELTALPRPKGIRSVDIDYTVRTLPNGKRFLFAVNESEQEREMTFDEPFSQIDVERGVGYAAQRTHRVAAHGSMLLEECGQYAERPYAAVRSEEIVPAYRGSTQNCLTIEGVRVALDDGTALDGYCYGVFETLVKRGYCGTIRVRYAFESDIDFDAVLTAEKQEVAKERWNGQEVCFSDCEADVNFRSARVHVRAGENFFEYEAAFTQAEKIRSVLFEASVPESLRNCFSYTTFMEPVYIEGNFDVDGGKIVAQSAKSAGDLTACGYENFCGYAEYSFGVKGTGRAMLRPQGDFSMCEFSDGENLYRVLLGEEVLVRLNSETTKFTVRCYSTMRNRFGPLHWKGDEANGVSPDCFTLRGGWTDPHTNPQYDAHRKVIPFGLRKIRVTYEQ